MWYLGPIYAGVTTLLWLVLFSYIKLTANTGAYFICKLEESMKQYFSEKDWGDISQALLYRVVVARLKVSFRSVRLLYYTTFASRN